MYFRIFGMAAMMAGAAFPQYVISARSGLVHYTEGKVYLEDKLTTAKAAEFPDIKEGQVLRTELGRAEILFSPGVFLRMAENSGFRMVSNQLEKTAIELTAGTVLLEAGEVEKGQTIRIAVGPTTIEVTKQGLYRVEAQPPSLRVYEGSAVVLAAGGPVTVKEGRRTELAGVVAPEKFNKEIGDPFHRWAGRRAGYIAMANVAAAKSMGEQQDVRWRASSWLYNPYFGSFTYIPFRGRYMSPFGWNYYSPGYVERVYYTPQPDMSGGGAGGGFGAIANRSSGDMGGRGMSSSPSYSSPAPAVSSPAPAASAPRSGDSGSSRESRGGR